MNHEAKIASVDENVRSVWLVIFMAVTTSALRIAIWAGNEIMLWQVYGRERMAREHLRITRIKPKLVVSNGDILWGKGFYHFLISGLIWLPLAVGLLFLAYYILMPKWHQETLQNSKEQTVNLVGLLWALALFFLIAGLLPLGASNVVSVSSVFLALIWARRIQYKADIQVGGYPI